jgi:CPA2 family monovalent cation:H+ antiporter-2
MPHHTPLIATLVAGLVLAFVLGALAHRVRASPIVGYLLAGVLVGPYTPGFVADPAMAAELAEIGVILLMFGVGLHFSLHDLLSVRAIAIPGALVQMAVATLLGMALAWALAGNSAPIWSSGWRCRSPAPWFCCAPCRSDGSSTPSRDASPSVG